MKHQIQKRPFFLYGDEEEGENEIDDKYESFRTNTSDSESEANSADMI